MDPVKAKLRSLGKTSLGQQLVESRRMADSPFVQALGYSWLNRATRAGAEVPIALTVRVQASARIEPGDPFFYRQLKAPVAADPLRLNRVDHVAIWRINADPAITKWANWLAQEVFPSSGKIPVCVIEELNPSRKALGSTLRQLTSWRSVPITERFTEQRNVVVITDPISTLPIVLARFWPLTRIVVVLNSTPMFPIEELAGIDALLVHESVVMTAVPDLAVPFVATFADSEKSASQLKALISGAMEPARGYFFCLKGEPHALGEHQPGSDTDIVVLLPEDAADPAAECRTFRDYFGKLMANAEAIAVHSRFLYSHESLIESGQVEGLLLDLIRRGARVQFVKSSQIGSQP